MATAEVKDRYFLPGQNLVIRPEWKRKALPRYAQARVTAPGRLHFCVFDFSKMAPGLGGGGLGVSTATAGNEVVVSVGKPGSETEGPASGQHLVQLFKEAVGYHRTDLLVEVPERIKHSHGGFGSNVTFNTSVLAGLNALFGSPFSVHELWDMLTQNFVENTEDHKRVYVGLDTGVGEACLLYGGLVWIDAGSGYGDGRFLGSIPTDNLWTVTCVGRTEKLVGEILLAFGKEGAEKGMGDKTEADVVAGACQQYQRQYGAALKQFLEEKMRPALLRNDLRELLSLGWEMNGVGNVKVLEGIYRTDILNQLTDSMRKANALYAGMSSAGPGFFAFSDSEAGAQKLKHVLEENFSEYFGNFAVGRAGGKLSIDLRVK